MENVIQIFTPSKLPHRSGDQREVIWFISTGQSLHTILLRSGVLAIGLIGSTLALSGLVAYAIVQVSIISICLSSIFNFTFLSLFRCQHCAPTLATTSPTAQLRRQRRRVSGRLTKQKALTVNCGISVKVYYV